MTPFGDPKKCYCCATVIPPHPQENPIKDAWNRPGKHNEFKEFFKVFVFQYLINTNIAL
jgi:hypothetical protein